ISPSFLASTSIDRRPRHAHRRLHARASRSRHKNEDPFRKRAVLYAIPDAFGEIVHASADPNSSVRLAAGRPGADCDSELELLVSAKDAPLCAAQDVPVAQRPVATYRRLQLFQNGG